ncbi:TIGR02234 family membrane protein [Modestobacter sp. I12A-02628]|uniref:Trp biosynthesis-associated membrane protein n=2 Tax=Goekera deserti TaxID=2497753 RepID=A0A7K3WA90_9ACTN|nr:TIGR02234 family membrane protein [Goekera deserti]NDI47567.1 TIGR02234 family membrane protein [Goekera deserti]NEL53378.1 Trp biosynthesis-associated membrane protein [Goekera deserti]
MTSGQTWVDVTVTRSPPLPPFTDQLSGAATSPLVSATGLVLLAAALAVLAVQGVLRAVVGVLMVLGGLALAWTGVDVLTGGSRPDLSDITTVSVVDATLDTRVHATWPVLAVLAGLVAVAVGAFVVLRGRRWSGTGRRYERTPGPAAGATARGTGPARPMTAEDRHQAAWKALDRGEDPTA